MWREDINLALFHLINAQNLDNVFAVNLGIFLADYLVYVVALFLILYWVFGSEQQKNIALKSVVIALVALCFAQLVGLVYPHPRPFVMGVGHTLIEHAPDYSFPSDHTTLCASIAISFLISKAYRIGLVLLIVAVVIGIARIYVGVHFPFDIMGGFVLSLLVALMMQPIWHKIGDRILQSCIALYEMIMGRLIKRN